MITLICFLTNVINAVRHASGCDIDTLLVVVGLNDGDTPSQCVCHISLERPDSVSTIDSTPAWVDEGASSCVRDG